MSESKQIRWQFVVDQTSVQQAQRVVRDLISDFERLGKAMSGMVGPQHGAGGGSPISAGGPQTQGTMISGVQQQSQKGAIGGMAGLAQSFTAAGSSLKNLAGLSQDSMRMMSSGIINAIEAQKKSIQSLDAELEKVTKSYDELAQKKAHVLGAGANADYAERKYGPSSDAAAGLQGQHLSLVEQRAEKMRVLDKLKNEQKEISPGADGPEGPPGKTPGGGGFGDFKNIARGLAIGAMVYGGIKQVAAADLATPTQFIDHSSREAQAMGGMGVATLGGSLKYAAGMHFMDAETRKDFDMAARQQASMAAQVGAGVLLDTGEVQTRLKERMRSMIDKSAAMDPEREWFRERLESEAGGRVAAMRRMGMSEQNQSRFYANAGGVGGFSAGELSGMYESVRGGGQGVAFGGGMRSMMRAQAGGMNLSVAGDFVIQSAQGAGDSGAEIIFKAVANNLDKVSGEKILQGVTAGLQGNLMGATGGAGFTAAMMSGLEGGSAQQIRMAQMRAGATGALGNFMSGGGDALGQSINILNAINTGKPGEDIYTTMARSKIMSDPAAVADVLSRSGDEGITPEMRAQGLHRSDFQIMKDENVKRSINARFLEQGEGTDISPATAAVKDLIENYGTDPKAWAASHLDDQSRVNLASGVQNLFQGSGFKNAEEAEAVMDIFTAIGQPLPEGVGKNHLGDAARAYKNPKTGKVTTGSTLDVLTSQLEVSEKKYGEMLAGFGEEFGKIAKGMGAAVETFKNMGHLRTSVESATLSLDAFTQALDRSTVKNGGKVPDKKALLEAAGRLKEEAEQKRSGQQDPTKPDLTPKQIEEMRNKGRY